MSGRIHYIHNMQLLHECWLPSGSASLLGSYGGLLHCYLFVSLVHKGFWHAAQEKQLFVKRLPGESWPGPYGEVLSLAINLDATVSCLMAMLEDASGIPADQMRLVISGARRQLERDCKLSDYNIHKESTIHMVLRLRGGRSSQRFLIRNPINWVPCQGHMHGCEMLHALMCITSEKWKKHEVF